LIVFLISELKVDDQRLIMIIVFLIYLYDLFTREER